MNKLRKSFVLLFTLAVMLLGINALCHGAATTRFWLVTQYDWDSKQGFFFDSENDNAKEDPAELKPMQLVFGIADGNQWRYLNLNRKWELNKDYAVKLIISPTQAEFWLDGKVVSRSKGKFKTFEGPFQVNGKPEWAPGLTSYNIIMKTLKVSTSDGDVYEYTYDPADFDPTQKPTDIEDITLLEDATTTIELTLTIVNAEE